MPQKSLSIVLSVIIPVLLVASVVTAVVGPPPVPGALIGSSIIVTMGDLTVGSDSNFVVTGIDGSLNIGPDNFTVAGATGNTVIAGNLTVTSGIEETVIGANTPANGSFTTLMAHTYRVTNAEEITESTSLTKADMQAASYWPVGTCSRINVVLSEALDAADVGRKLTFAITECGWDASWLMVSSGESGITVTTKSVTGNYDADRVGDYIECLITAPDQATCTIYASYWSPP